MFGSDRVCRGPVCHWDGELVLGADQDAFRYLFSAAIKQHVVQPELW